MTNNDISLKSPNNDQIYLTIYPSIQDVVASHYLKKILEKEFQSKSSFKISISNCLYILLCMKFEKKKKINDRSMMTMCLLTRIIEWIERRREGETQKMRHTFKYFTSCQLFESFFQVLYLPTLFRFVIQLN